ncbi:uncharacterized protein B0I36DRAFT_378642 [Microdochium trichocladiopsis]|uniref:Cupin type-2 domain-containing protein n=1 Tax=Microdochium trichocladiopsis TaxID=1682393 RepID=A0A9P8XPI3_9PEZI|nr:uncharacterized protein B0I36DRAFT_378642 [Microdochium trichocladiopsis]KAH7009271.1 hypothetical protein B0I36DRAFT_378642 [Microdochium trichocladiopsis]
MARPKRDFQSGLPQARRFITTHDDTGKAIYSEDLPEIVPFWAVGPRDEPAAFGLVYATTSTPVPLTKDEDLTTFRRIDEQRTRGGLVHSGGSAMRYVDYPPKASSPMHRTVSCDYAVVLFGQVGCRLDSGEERVLNAGDVLVQRGTMHQWVNLGDTWARMLYVLIDSAPVESGGVILKEDLGGMEGVPESH